MRIFLPDLDNYTLDADLGEDWVNVTRFDGVTADTLTTQDRLGRRFIAAPDGVDVARRYLHRRYSPFNDHAVEAIVDRAWPYRSGTTEKEIGLIALWRVTERELADTLIREGPANTLYTPDPLYPTTEDLSLGENDHVRWVVTDTAAKVYEVRGGVETEHFSMDLDPSARVIALRAAAVDGEIMFWINPGGFLSFEDAPVAKILTLIPGATRCGILAGPRGRLWSPRVEFQTESLGGEPAIDQSGQETLVFDPVRVSVTPDESRPPMETTLQICHWEDTPLGERVERKSRVHLRDGRFMLRPGKTYRVTGHVRTTDGQLVRIQPKVFDLDIGDAEEEGTLLLDAQGAAVYHPDYEMPAGYARSSTGAIGWPTTIDIHAPLSSSLDPSFDSLVAKQDFINRQVNRTSFSPRVWVFSVSSMTDAQVLELRQFIDTLRGRINRFVWIHPLTGEHVLVRMDEPGITATYLEGGASAQITIREQFPHIPLVAKDTAPTVASDPTSSGSGYTSGGSSGGTSGGSSGSVQATGGAMKSGCTPSSGAGTVELSFELCLSCLGTVTCSGTAIGAVTFPPRNSKGSTSVISFEP